MSDALGTVHMSLADLPGRMLTTLMLDGLAHHLRMSKDARTAWLTLKAGLRQIAANRRVPKVKHDKPRALTLWQRAIMCALAELPDCTASHVELEEFARSLTQPERRLWAKEPAVRLHYRHLIGQPASGIESLLDQMNAGKGADIAPCASRKSKA